MAKGAEKERVIGACPLIPATKENGSGLGLSISYGIVKVHGGEISAISTEGEGTIFRVILPLTPATV